MVRKILNFLHTEISHIHEAAYLLGFFAIVSQLLALLRDRLFTYSFGASHLLDIYYAAFRIPDFMFASLCSIVSVSVLIPFLVDKLSQDKDDAKKFVDDIFSIFFFTIVAVALIVFFLAPMILRKLFPGYVNDALFPELLLLTRIMLLSPIFLGISNFLASITQIYNRFFIYALSPILYNVGIIFGILVLYPRFGIKGVAYGVALGAFCHFAIQVPFVWEIGFLPSLTFRIDFAAIKNIVLISLPRTLAVSSNEIAELILVSFASLMTSGSISIFNFSFNLQSVPLSIIGVSYSLAAFPTLTRYFSRGEKNKFVDQMIATASHIVFLCLPVMALFIVLRAQIVRVVLGSSIKFNWDDTRLTAAAIALFTLSLIPQSLVVLFVRAYYASGNTKKPLLINVLSSTFIVAFGYFLIRFFAYSAPFRTFIESVLKVDHIQGTTILMIPLAYSVGVTINMLIHWISFQRDFPAFSKPVLHTFLQSMIASLILGFVAYECLDIFDNIFNITTFIGIFLQGLCSGLLGILAALVTLKLMGSKELSEIWATLHRKFWKAEVIASDPETL